MGGFAPKEHKNRYRIPVVIDRREWDCPSCGCPITDTDQIAIRNRRKPDMEVWHAACAWWNTVTSVTVVTDDRAAPGGRSRRRWSFYD